MFSPVSMNLYGLDAHSNTFQQPIVKWKKHTYYQSFPTIQKNGGMMFKNPLLHSCYCQPQPLKIYRNELTKEPTISRLSIRINKIVEQPGGFVFFDSQPTNQNTVIDAKKITIATDEKNKQTNQNAMNRVRNRNMFNNNAIYVNKPFTTATTTATTTTNGGQGYSNQYTPTTNLLSLVPPSSDYLQYYTTLQPTTPPDATNLSNITIAGRTLTNLLLVKPNLHNCCELE